MMINFKKYITIIKYEFLVTIKSNLQYKISFVSEFIIFFFTFFAVIFFGSSEIFQNQYHIDSSQATMLLFVGYVFWQFSIQALGYCSSSIKSNARSGILELKLQSKFPYIMLLLINVFVDILCNIITLMILFFVSILLSNTSIKDAIYILLLLVFIIPSVFGMFGMGMFFGGISLKEKNIGSGIMIFQAALLFVSNVTSTMTIPMTMIIPFTLGIEIVRELYIYKTYDITLIILYCLINLAWFILGTIFFNYFLNRERKIGSFDNY